MDFLKIHTVNAVIWCLLFLGLLYVVVWTPSLDKTPFAFQSCRCRCRPSSTSNTLERGEDRMMDGLERALSGASTADKTVILTVINKAYVEGDKAMLDLFLDGFWLGEDTQGLLDHLLLVAVDQTSFDRCKFLHLHCYKLETEGVDFRGEMLYMSQDFNNMMWTRTLFLTQVLEKGYSFIFTDTDVMWLRNPFPRLTLNNNNNQSSSRDIDLQISVDCFNGDEWSDANPINTGFYMIKSNNRTLKLFETWYGNRNSFDGLKEQDVLEGMKRDGVLRELGVRTRYLDCLYFSGFCTDSRDFNAVTTVHANCCRSIQAKLADLTVVLHDWLAFKNSPPNQTSTLQWSTHAACSHSW